MVILQNYIFDLGFRNKTEDVKCFRLSVQEGGVVITK